MVINEKPTCRNQCETAVTTGLSQQCLLCAEVLTTQLYESRVYYAMKPERMIKYLKWKTGLVMRVEKLESPHNVNFIYFYDESAD